MKLSESTKDKLVYSYIIVCILSTIAAVVGLAFIALSYTSSAPEKKKKYSNIGWASVIPFILFVVIPFCAVALKPGDLQM